MRTFKALMTGLAVGAVSVVMAASAFAAGSLTDGVASVEATDYTAATSGQMTVLIVESSVWDNIETTDITSDDIYYINQFAYDEASTVLSSMGVKGSDLPLNTDENGDEVDTTYYVLIGDEAGTVQSVSIELKAEGSTTPALAKGDADGSGVINESDAVSILDYCIELATYTVAQLAAADTDGGGAVNESDAVDILDYCLELPSYVAGTK